MRKGVLISTTEHLLSVFYSMGIDNAFIEIDNLEVPILDGSGQPFVELMAKAGMPVLPAETEISSDQAPVRVEERGKSASPSCLRTSSDSPATIFFDHRLVGGSRSKWKSRPERYARRSLPRELRLRI